MSRVPATDGLQPAVFDAAASTFACDATRRCGPHRVRPLRRIEGMTRAHRAIFSHHPSPLHSTCGLRTGVPLAVGGAAVLAPGGGEGAPTRGTATGGRRPKDRAQQRAPTLEPAVPVREEAAGPGPCAFAITVVAAPDRHRHVQDGVPRSALGCEVSCFTGAPSCAHTHGALTLV